MSRADRKAASGLFGLLLIDKPPGPTSHDLVGWVRWALRERSVGHCGTLDPPASGLLVLCVGEATKLAEHLTGVDKVYRARFVLGRETSTADADGETLVEAEVPASIEAAAVEALASLRGSLRLAPPAVSAIKVQGKRAHALVRAGEAPILAERDMAVHELSIEGHGRTGEGGLWIDAQLRVAKGTYVRSLALELGRRLGLPAHLGSLRRLACGSSRVDDGLAITGLTPEQLPPIDGRPPKWRVELPRTSADPEDREDARSRANEHLRARLIEPWTRLPFEICELPRGGAHGPLVSRLLQGQRLRADGQTRRELGISADSGPCALVDHEAGRVIILRRDDDRLAPARIIRMGEPQSSGPDH